MGSFAKQPSVSADRYALPSAGFEKVFSTKILGIAAAAHELKTPLSILSGYTRLLLDGSLGELNEPQRRVLDEMDRGAVRLQRFVADFLAYGALEAGHFIPKLSLHDINGTVAETLEIWKQRFLVANKRLTFHAAANLPLVPCDELKIQHVLSNLLDNAMKFTPKDSQVTVHTRPYFWERRLAQPGDDAMVDRRRRGEHGTNSVRVDVRDSGPGIAPENYQEVFSPFHRLHAGPNTEGVGLGLAIAKRVIDSHGGKIWVESEPGAGATFSFLLPLSKSKAFTCVPIE